MFITAALLALTPPVMVECPSPKIAPDVVANDPRKVQQPKPITEGKAQEPVVQAEKRTPTHLRSKHPTMVGQLVEKEFQETVDSSTKQMRQYSRMVDGVENSVDSFTGDSASSAQAKPKTNKLRCKPAKSASQ
ncbi:MAG: hypothetical protein AAGE86_15340 [Pseudomonadota bacterium]